MEHNSTCHALAKTSSRPDEPYFIGSIICYCMEYEEAEFEELVDKLRNDDKIANMKKEVLNK
jgi:hypothetical protein